MYSSAKITLKATSMATPGRGEGSGIGARRLGGERDTGHGFYLSSIPWEVIYCSAPGTSPALSSTLDSCEFS